MTFFQFGRSRLWFRWVSVTAVLMLLAGCGNGKCAMPSGSGPVSLSSQSGLKIDEYGPHETKAAQPFNRQPDGSSAAWFRLNQNMDGSLVNVHMNNMVLKGDISGPLVTVRVPDALFASAGHVTVTIDKVDGAHVTTSNSINIIVEKQ